MAGKKLSQFLRYVVEQTLNGQPGSIKQYTIAVEAYGYGSDFDPQHDPAIRIQAQRLRRALEQYYFTEGVEDPVRIDIPKGGYVPIFGLRNANNPPSPQTVREDKIPQSSHSSPKTQQSGPILAVLTLSNLCQGESLQYLADGLTEEILIALSRFSKLPVMGALSRERLRQEQLGPRQIGARYGVRFVLDGSVRGQKGKIRIGTKLTDASTGAHVWAETYDAQIDRNDLFKIEQDISLKVLGATADVHGVIYKTLVQELRKTPPVNLSAHQAMLKL